MIGSAAPLVSVIICTYNRPAPLQMALHSVLQQDIQDFEIIVVDDGSDPCVELQAVHGERVRLVRSDHGGIGSARSEALKHVRGAFVAYCDDDDEWKPNHLSTLLAFLLDHPEVDLVYADSEWEQEGCHPSVAFSIDYDLSELLSNNYIFATDVMHRTQAAREVGGFDASLQASEDWDLWLRMSQRCVLWHLRSALSIHHWYGDCVSSSELHWYEGEKVKARHVRRLAEEGVAPNHQPVHSQGRIHQFDPETWQEGHRDLIWHSIMNQTHSYGHVARRLLLTLEGLGVDITMAPFGNQPVADFERFYKPVDHYGRLAFYYHYSPEIGTLPFERLVVYSMWESRSVPREHVEEINRAASLLYVPCRQNMEDFEASGVRIPIKVLHHGVDSNCLPYLERPTRDTFTFGTFGNLSIPRKGANVLIRAFQDEFCSADPVRLILKSSRPPSFQLSDPRIRIISGFVDPPSLLEILREMDVFILPSRGEGFGLCGLEAMSTGLPLIATNWSGPQEYLSPDDSFPLSYRLEDAKGSYVNDEGHFGLWAEPDYEHLRYLMRYLYEHPGEARAKGRKASERVHREWSWNRIGNQICSDLDAVANAG